MVVVVSRWVVVLPAITLSQPNYSYGCFVVVVAVFWWAVTIIFSNFVIRGNIEQSHSRFTQVWHFNLQFLSMTGLRYFHRSKFRHSADFVVGLEVGRLIVNQKFNDRFGQEKT